MHGFTTTFFGLSSGRAAAKTIQATQNGSVGVCGCISLQGGLQGKPDVEMPPEQRLAACNPRLTPQAVSAIGPLLLGRAQLRKGQHGFLCAGRRAQHDVRPAAASARQPFRRASARWSSHVAPVRAA